MRTFDVLARPSAAFRNCEPGKDIMLLKGKGNNAKLFIDAKTRDDEDGWSAHISFVPDSASQTAATGSATGVVGKVAEKVASAIEKATTTTPWTKTFTAAPGARTIEVPVNEAGTYTLTRVAGELCEGDVRAPEVCRVVEVPLPRAEVEVERIHEW